MARPPGPGIKEKRIRLEILTLGRDIATVNLEFKVRGQDQIGRQSQTWVRFPGPRLEGDQRARVRGARDRPRRTRPAGRAAGKYLAAAQARDDADPDFVLITRTDARGGTAAAWTEVIRRAKGTPGG